MVRQGDSTSGFSQRALTIVVSGQKSIVSFYCLPFTYYSLYSGMRRLYQVCNVPVTRRSVIPRVVDFSGRTSLIRLIIK